MNYIDLTPYSLPIFISSLIIIFTIWVISYNESLLSNNLKINKNRFTTGKAKWLYLMSFKMPFIWFVEDDNDLTPKGVIMKSKLKKTGLDKYFTPRSWMSMKVYIFFISIIFIVITSTALANLHLITNFILNIDTVPVFNTSFSYGYQITSSIEIFLLAFDLKIAVVLLLLSMYPNIYMMSKLSKLKTAYNKDIPILQMFIILMLRSKKTIGEIIYGLSKIDTPHSEAFNVAHRMYIRSHSAGLEYLKEYFDGHRFGDTFVLLDELDLYSRDDSIDIMQSNLINIIEDIKLAKQKQASSKIIYSQASMIIPFSAVILLGMIPIIVFGMSNLTMEI